MPLLPLGTSKAKGRPRRGPLGSILAEVGAFVCLAVAAAWPSSAWGTCKAPAALDGRGLYGRVGAYDVLARCESISGRLAVVQHREDGYRLLKCSHSLLGGVFVETGDSVYSAFVMHEAVRLVEFPDDRSGSAETTGGDRICALQIGLGIGVAPLALAKHGVRVDVVEYDEMVVNAATDFFEFSIGDGQLYVADARAWLRERAQQQPRAVYDFILHDVFSGGSTEPRLFTEQLFKDAAKLLRDEPHRRGVLVVNFWGFTRGARAADTRMLLRTLRRVFAHVRLFADDDGVGDADELDTARLHEEEEVEPRNLVFFASRTRMGFRAATEQDFLGSVVRESVLGAFPRLEVDVSEVLRVPSSLRAGDGDELDDEAVIDDAAAERLAVLQRPAALAHHAILNSVWPHEFWANI